MSDNLSMEQVESLRERILQAAIDGKKEEIRSSLQDLPAHHVAAVLHGCVKELIVPSPYRKLQFTPLSFAVSKGHLEVVKLLVEDYAMNMDLAVVPTALGAAVRNRHLHIVQYLVTHGCDVNLINPEGKTAIFVACEDGNLDIAKYLQQKGACTEIPNAMGQTCLMQACVRNNVNMARWLLDCGADVNKRDGDGNTAMHIAACGNLKDLVQLLLEQGAVIVRNYYGLTPVTRAAAVLAHSVVKYFAESPKVSQEDKIQGLELLGARTLNMDIAFIYLRRAMEERHRDPNHVIPKAASPLPVLSHLRESVSLEELEARESNHKLLRLECWATMQRILGLDNPQAWRIYRSYMSHLNNDERRHIGTSLLLQYAESGNDPSMDLWLEFLPTFLSNLKDGLSGDPEPPFQDWVNVLGFILQKMPENRDNQEALAEDESWLAECLHCLLSCLDLDPDCKEGTPLTKLTGNLVHLSSLLRQNQCILAEAIRVISDEFTEFKEDRPYMALVELFLQRGADPNHRDEDGRTPLHLVAELSESEQRQACLQVWASITRILLKAGALPGVRDPDGKTALQLAASSPVKEAIQEFQPSSLKSLAAVAVLENNIAFQSEVPHDLAAFVEQH